MQKYIISEINFRTKPVLNLLLYQIRKHSPFKFNYVCKINSLHLLLRCTANRSVGFRQKEHSDDTSMRRCQTHNNKGDARS